MIRLVDAFSPKKDHPPFPANAPVHSASDPPSYLLTTLRIGITFQNSGIFFCVIFRFLARLPSLNGSALLNSIFMLVVAAMLKQHLVPRGSKNTIGIQYCNLILIATTSLLLLATTPIAGFDIRK